MSRLSSEERAEEQRLNHVVSSANAEYQKSATNRNKVAFEKAARELDAFRAARVSPSRQSVAVSSVDYAKLLPDSHAAFVEFTAMEKETVAFVVQRGSNGAVQLSAHRLKPGAAE